jgi:hypothetical protein
MNKRFATTHAGAVITVVLLGACSENNDDSTTLASGNDVELVGDGGLGGQTLDISAEKKDGAVTGELRFSDPGGEVVVAVECADTNTDGVVILGGTVTASPVAEISGLIALFIREGDPDSVTVWLDDGENDSCGDLLVNRHDVLDDESAFVDVEAGSDIKT